VTGHKPFNIPRQLGMADLANVPRCPAFLGGRPDPDRLKISLLVILLGQLRRGRRESSEQTVGIIINSRREEQCGAR
jgi:hypothetical protein